MESAHLGLLYVIATPIGNVEDISLRARRIIAEVSHFIVEDTREAKKLLALVDIPLAGKEFHSYASHNIKEATRRAISLLVRGCDLALLTDRGTPTVSDPGAILVEDARERGMRVVPIPGPSCVTTSLSVSGFDASRFLFLGFVPRKGKPRLEFFETLEASSYPICFLESPRRIRKTMRDLKERMPLANVVIARELTKQFETISSNRVGDLNIDDIPELGEFTLVFSNEKPTLKPTDLEKDIKLKLASDKEWAKSVSKIHGISSSEAYNALQKGRRV